MIQIIQQRELFLSKRLDKIHMATSIVFFFGMISSIAFANNLSLIEKTYSKTYYTSGNIKAEGWIVNSKKNGYWKFYYRSGQLEKEGHFYQNKPTKYWYFYRNNGILESEGHFENGNKTNWWLFYDISEKIDHKCQLRNNQKNGYCLIYNNNEIVKATKFKDGKKVNEWTDLNSFKNDNKLSDLK